VGGGGGCGLRPKRLSRESLVSRKWLKKIVCDENKIIIKYVVKTENS